MLDVDRLLLGAASVLTMVVAILFVVKDLRQRSVSGATVFLVVSVVFINLGMSIRWLAPGADPVWSDRPVMVVTAGLAAVILGSRLGPMMWPLRDHVGGPSAKQGTDQDEYNSLFVTSLVLVLVAGLYFALLGSIPLVQGLKDLAGAGQITSGLVSRYRNARDTYAGGTGVYVPMQGLLEAVRYWGLPLVVIWAWQAIAARRWRHAGFVLIGAALVLLVATGQRWPLMYLFIAVFVVGVVIFRWRWGRLGRWALLAIAVGVVLSALLGRGAQGVDSVGKAFRFGVGQLSSRLFLEQTEVPFASYAMSRADLLPGDQLTWVQNLLAYLPGPGASYTVTFSTIVTGQDLGFTAPPDFYTEAWINGGWWLVIALSFAWGLLIGRIRMLPAGSSAVSVGYRTVLVTILGFSAFAGVSQALSVFIVFVLAKAIFLTFRFLAPRASQQTRSVPAMQGSPPLKVKRS